MNPVFDFFCASAAFPNDPPEALAVHARSFVLELRYPELALRTEYPNLGKLMDMLMQRPSFADTKPGA